MSLAAESHKLVEAQLRARALAMAIRGHFSTSSEGDAEVLEALALDCVRHLDELLAIEEKRLVVVLLIKAGASKIEAIKTVRALTGLGLKEANDLVEAVPTAILEGVAVADANRAKDALESVGATVTLLE
jgi:ribosomal protein L7/L12